MDTIKTRFAPSPTGWLHVGGARTALFNYLLAKQADGIFLLRIEDTDQARHDESAVGKIIEDLRWLGIEWDEGVEIGGDNGPYRQSERLEIYTEHIRRLLDAGKAYYAFETPEELDAMRTAARAEKRNFRYPRPDPLPSADDVEKARAEGRPVVVRFKIPGRDVTIHDEVFGEVTVAAAEQDDFIIAKTDGWPTYHLANVVDDAMMGVNFVMRGQEFLSQTWRHVLLREAFGFDEPRYAHLPLIMDMAGRKLSKRDGAVEVHAFRTAGYLPEALVNFIALLGWNPGDGRERLTMTEMIESFSVDRIGKANAKFDREKLLAFNTDAVAKTNVQQLTEKFADFSRTVTDSLRPAQEAMSKFMELYPQMSAPKQEAMKGIMESVTQAFLPAQEAIKRITASLRPAQNVWERLAESLHPMQTDMERVANSLAPVQKALSDFSMARVFMKWVDADIGQRLLESNKGFRTFNDILAKCGVLFVADDAFDYDEKAVKKVLAKGDGAGYAMLEHLKAKLTDCEWTEDALQALIESICAEKSVGMGKVAQPIRVAVTGTTVSPAIYDTLLILGKEKTLARIDRCLAMRE